MAWNPGSALLPVGPSFDILWSPEDGCTRPLPFVAFRVSRPPPGAQHPPWYASPPVRGFAPSRVPRVL